MLSEDAPALNRGEAAILRGLAASFARHLGPVDLLLLSADPANDQLEYADVCGVLAGPGARTTRVVRRLPRRARVLLQAGALVATGCLVRVVGTRLAGALVSGPVLKAYLGADVILIGHDNLIVGPGMSPQFVAKVAFSRLTGKVSVVCGGSFGPFRAGPPETMAAWVLRRCTRVVLREPSSYEYATGLVGEQRHVTLGADPAFLMRPATVGLAAGAQDARFDGVDGAIGFTVAQGSLVDGSAFADSDPGLAPAERHARHLSVMTEAIRNVATKTGCRILLVAHSLDGRQNDLLPTWEIFTRLRDDIDIDILDPSLSAPQVKWALSRLSLLVAERVHSAIAACSTGVPVLVISKPSDFRAYGIVGTMLGLDECLYDVRSLDAVSLTETVIRLWQERERLRARLEAALPAVLEAADSVGPVTAEALALS